MPDMSRKEYADKMASELAAYLGRAITEVMVAQNPRNTMPNCLTCAFFNEQHSWCSKAQANPPPRVIVNSCGWYEDVEKVPF